jgi:aldehyde dehydrogenase (NAD+)
MVVREIFHSMAYGPAPEAPNAAYAWLDAHAVSGGPRSFGLFIDGRFTPAEGGRTLESRDPATGAVLARVADGTAADADRAVAAARAAFPAWSGLSGHARARHLYAIARAVQKHSRILAVLESLDNGKPIRESRDLDVPLVARHFYYHAGWAQLAETELAGYGPVGVVGQIIPWNFPLLMMAWKLAPALAMGNTVVLKPAPYTSLTALLLAEVIHEAGLPPGVVNIVTGGDETGAALTAHPDIDKIAFTGSTGVGKIIRRVTAGSGKRLSLELGGKSPFIVFDDADQDAAVEGLVDAIWFNQGQVCCAGSRVLVQESIAEPFLKRVRRRMDTLRIGSPLDKAIDVGAIVDPVQRATIDMWVQRGIAEGAHVYQAPCPVPNEGCWYPPTLLTGVEASASVAQEEIFGPVAVALTFRTPKEAVALANNTRYGLAATVWSESINLALDVARRLKAGTVWVNATNLFDAASGFGGYRESGYGREGGREGLYEYLRPRAERRPAPLSETAREGWHKWTEAVPAQPLPVAARDAAPASDAARGLPALDRTAKLFIGGKQARPDGAYSRPVLNADGTLAGQVGDGNRKDMRDAVEAAASAAAGWGAKSGHARAQILYYLGENLAARADEFARRIDATTGRADGAAEVAAAIDRAFTFAAWADKYGGTLQETPLRGLTLAVNEPIGVVGVVAPDAYPLLGLLSLVLPLMARGNVVVAVPSQAHPLSATDLYQVIETSDVPAGVFNLVTGARDTLTKTLAEHDAVEAVWYMADALGGARVEYASAHNMKRTFVMDEADVPWMEPPHTWTETLLRESVQVKNVWLPTGE